MCCVVNPVVLFADVSDMVACVTFRSPELFHLLQLFRHAETAFAQRYAPKRLGDFGILGW